MESAAPWATRRGAENDLQRLSKSVTGRIGARKTIEPGPLLIRIAVMRNENGFSRSAVTSRPISPIASSLHPAWSAFIRYCSDLQHGEIEVLKIQDGLPVLAEVTRKKVKFAP